MQIRTIGENDVGAFAARFQPDAFHVAITRVFQQLFTRTRGAGKGDGIDIVMTRKRLPGFMTITAHYVQHAIRQPRFFFCQPGETNRTEW
ncbi:Uncharacterised protein [Shigella sonnei]|nr:Uncharacterised protein [Shigella sonnei]CSS20764.1 Uncharacterised protein [Shigella sonnei]